MAIAVDELQRCGWAQGSDELMRAYHDEEWGVPIRDSRALWELLMLEGFQAGLSWSIILRKRKGFRRAFAGFDPERVARFDEGQMRHLQLSSQYPIAYCDSVASAGNGQPLPFRFASTA